MLVFMFTTLIRGLLMPKLVVDDLGGSRTDAGMLGQGIYFADMVSKSANYCCTSRSNNTGLLLLCDVALGNM